MSVCMLHKLQSLMYIYEIHLYAILLGYSGQVIIYPKLRLKPDTCFFRVYKPILT